jgi:haloalkane dehalogenase
MAGSSFGRRQVVVISLLSWLLLHLCLCRGQQDVDSSTLFLLDQDNNDDNGHVTNPLAVKHQSQGRLVLAGGVEIFVVEQDGTTAGTGDDEQPPILCLHGVPASSFVYRKLLPELANRGYRAMAIDFPGLGFSSRPDPKLFNYSWTGMGEWLGLATTESLFGTSSDKFHLVVHDLAVPWGMKLAADFPERIMSLTILNGPLVNLESWVVPPSMALYRKPFPIDRLYLATWQSQPFLFLLGQYIFGVLLDPTEFGLKEADAYLQQLFYSDHHARAFLAIMKGFEKTSENEDLYIGAINALNVPKQIIWSESDTGFPVQDYAIPLQEKTGIDRLFIVEGKHFLQENSYKVIAEYIDDMLQS